MFYKKILLGVTGSIAAYKSAEIIRLFKRYNIEIKVIMTKSALEFIQPLTFSTLSNNAVYSKMFEQDKLFDCEHIELAKWADLILIAPCTANIIAKLANGIADDLLTTTCLACEKPIYLAPTMNKIMWKKESTQTNIFTLKNRGTKILGPADGEQACGDIGFGRMLEPKEIVTTILDTQNTLLKNKKIVITAGSTIEHIDPVRFISNRSSGKTGYAIASAAIANGAKVTLISGPTNLNIPQGCDNYKKVNTTCEMYDAVMKEITNCNIFIATAAPSDYRAEKILDKKIKRVSKDQLILTLIKNPDILSAVASLDEPPLTIGFAAETENLKDNAIKKLHLKNIDIIAANLVGHGRGFDADENSLTLITKSGEIHILERKSKILLADELIMFIDAMLQSQNL